MKLSEFIQRLQDIRVSGIEDFEVCLETEKYEYVPVDAIKFTLESEKLIISSSPSVKPNWDVLTSVKTLL